jgi:MFS family permease
MEYSKEEASRTLGLLELCALLAGGPLVVVGLFSMGIILPQIAASFAGTSDAKVLTQLIGGATGIGFALSSPYIGRLIEKFGYRRVYLLGLIVFAIAGPLPALLHNIILILVARITLGIAVTATVTAAATGISKLPALECARMLGLQALVGSSSGIVLFPIVGALARSGWRLPFLVHLVALVVLPMAARLPEQGHSPVAVERNRDGAGDKRAFLGLILVTAFAGMTMFLGGMYAPFYLNSIGVTDPILISIPYVGTSIASMLAGGVYGKVRAHFDTGRILTGALFLIGLGLLIAGYSTSLPLFTVCLITYSIGQSTFAPNVIAIAIARSKGNPAVAIGVINATLFSGPIFFPFVASFLGRLDGPKGVLLAFGACSLILAMLFRAKLHESLS